MIKKFETNRIAKVWLTLPSQAQNFALWSFASQIIRTRLLIPLSSLLMFSSSLVIREHLISLVEIIHSVNDLEFT